ncbi:copper resistance protein NlpE [Thaumasiovibrio sp. DFM-14]|uniref:copper resistance protein NlpE n=1 Tax=Thaumasiovibrio sp. DFM-14 TaxID=3384792 RepID=UPI0039A2E63D
MKKTLLTMLLSVLVMAGCKPQTEEAVPAQLPEVSEEQAELPVQLPEEVEGVDGIQGAEGEALQKTTKPVQIPEGDLHTAQNALDWNGTYTGTLPCDECEGITTQLTLNFDGEYTLVEQFIGSDKEDNTVSGQIAWNAAGNTITLDDKHYFVAEGRLFQLDDNGEQIASDQAMHYELIKE